MPKKRRVFLVHWQATECAERVQRLQDLGYDVAAASDEGGQALRTLEQHAPQALVIDLSRLPSHGRQVALAVRQQKKTRHIPLVFVDGDPDKVARLRDVLPDATYTTWPELRAALRQTIASPPASPIVPATNPAGYSGTPLPKKLAIKEGHSVVLLHAPADFAATLGDLPRGVKLSTRRRAGADVIVFFTRRHADLSKAMPSLVTDLGDGGGLWIAWPKQAAVKTQPELADTDIDENKVRALGLDAGIVDNKVCAIDATWSGLRFQRRRK
jgi:CheY-like chemotaxis protein